MIAKTISSEKIWSSPDGSRSIWSAKLDTGGVQYSLKTYSGKIAQVGFEGDVETYQKGDQRFVKQVPKENNFTNPGASITPPTKTDPNTIRAQFAIKAAIACIGAGAVVPIDNKKDSLGVVLETAKRLFTMVDEVKAVALSASAQQNDTVVTNFDDDEPINVDDIPF